jgi:hypothetical protein
MMLRVVNAQQAIHTLVRDLELASTVDVGPDKLLEYGDTLKPLDLWTLDEVEALIPLPNNLAALLAQSLDEIISVTRAFERAQGGGVLVDSDTRKSFASFYRHALGQSSTNLHRCVIECVRAQSHLNNPDLDAITD